MENTEKERSAADGASEGSGKENDEPVIRYYQSLLNFLEWEDRGSLIAGGVLRIGDIEGKPELRKAYELGKSIH